MANFMPDSSKSIQCFSKCCFWEKTSACRPCGGRKRSILKQTDDFIRLPVKKFHDIPLRAIKQKHLLNISLPVIYKRLKIHISMLNIKTYVFNLPKSSWKGPRLFGDQYTSLMSPFSRTQLPMNPKG